MRHLALILTALLAACTAPSQHDAAVYGTVRVGLGPSLDGVYDWTPDQRDALATGLVALSALGPTFVVVGEGESDVTVRAASLAAGCGSFRHGLRYVEVDAACASQQGGMPAVVRAACHEALHFYLDTRFHFWGHLCRQPGDAPDCHPTVTCNASGDCLMARGLVTPTDGPGFSEAFGAYADPAPTADDARLVRVLAGRE